MYYVRTIRVLSAVFLLIFLLHISVLSCTKTENQSCDGPRDTSCCTARCSYDYKYDINPLPGQVGYICCDTECVFDGKCYGVGARIDFTGSLYPHRYCKAVAGDPTNAIWETQLFEEMECNYDYECISNKCAENIEPLGPSSPSHICCETGCAYKDSCRDVGSTEYPKHYCSPDGGWRLQKRGECRGDFECSEGSCVPDAIGQKSYCCPTECVYNGTCYENRGDRAGELYCNGERWEAQLEDMDFCSFDYECKSNKCIRTYDGGQRCSSNGKCIYNQTFYESGKSHNLTSNKREFCNNYIWYDCQTDIDCEEPHYWCDDSDEINPFTCKPPVCGNYRCETDWGGISECKTVCADCRDEECIGDGFCNPQRGENCLTATSDCKCKENELCIPSDNRANEFGCVTPVCGDGICDIEADECNKNCKECNIIECRKDERCNPAVGENCLTAPQQCVCKPGSRCEPSNPKSMDDGCYYPACGNGICDKDKGECSTGCTDCKLSDCIGDGLCTYFNSTVRESCLNSLDCSCSAGEFCNPDNKKSDNRGCYKPLCGDGDCDGNETCETCSKDCGICNSVKPTAITADINPDETFRQEIVISNYHTQKILRAEIKGDLDIIYDIMPYMVEVTTKSEKMVVFTLNPTMEDPPGKHAGKITVIDIDKDTAIAEIPVTVNINKISQIEINREKISIKSKTQQIVGFDFEIRNSGNTDLFINIKIEGSLSDQINLANKTFNLEKGHTHLVTAEIDIPKELDIGVYETTLVIIYNDMKKELPFILTITDKLPYCGDLECQKENNEDCNTCPSDCKCKPSIRIIPPVEEIITEPGKPEYIKITVENTGGLHLNKTTLKIKPVSANIKGQGRDLLAGEKLTFDVILAGFPEYGDKTLIIEVKTAQGVSDQITLPVRIIKPQSKLNSLIKQKIKYEYLIKELSQKQAELDNYDIIADDDYLRQEMEDILYKIKLLNEKNKELNKLIEKENIVDAELVVKELESEYNIIKNKQDSLEKTVKKKEEEKKKLKYFYYLMSSVITAILLILSAIIIIKKYRRRIKIPSAKEEPHINISGQEFYGRPPI